ncbi:MAG: hypothetical protein JO138_21145 [Acidobacteriaceae bacterium]|nr:hypothetical protein [Acidobacteriaceae bacterium]
MGKVIFYGSPLDPKLQVRRQPLCDAGLFTSGRLNVSNTRLIVQMDYATLDRLNAVPFLQTALSALIRRSA